MSEIVVTDPTIVVVLGKKRVRKDEIEALRTFGRALHRRGKTLFTTKSEGAPAEVAIGYSEAGGTPHWITGDFLQQYEEQVPHKPIVIFTDMQTQTDLDKKSPDWRSKNLIVIHNPKQTQEAARQITGWLNEWNTPI